MVTVNIAEISKKTSCIDPKMTEPVFEAILLNLREGKHVDVSFNGVDRIITAFLNVAIGKLYNPAVFDQSKIDSMLGMTDATENQRLKAEEVIKYAKMFYNDPDRLKQIQED